MKFVSAKKADPPRADLTHPIILGFGGLLELLQIRRNEDSFLEGLLREEIHSFAV